MGQDVEPFHYWKSTEVVASFTKQEVQKGLKLADRGAKWDPPALDYLYEEGYSLQYPAIELHWKKPYLFQDLTASTGVYCRLNMYVTPKNNQGFKAHFDSHDVYVLQLRGSKHWKIYKQPPTLHDFPVSDWGDNKLEIVRQNVSFMKETALLMDVVLEEGDALYIPRGHLHEADCDGLNGSTHVTVGFMTMKVSDLIYVSLMISLGSDNKFQANVAPYRHLLRLNDLKIFLVEATSRNSALRRSALQFCVKGDQNCRTPSSLLQSLYVSTLRDFVSAGTMKESLKKEMMSILR